MIDDYTDLPENRPNSLLARYFAAYWLVYGDQDVHIVVMNNVFRSEITPDFIYDLKGTTEDRFVVPKSGAVLKDLNFDYKRISFQDPSVGAEFLDHIATDSQLLAQH